MYFLYALYICLSKTGKEGKWLYDSDCGYGNQKSLNGDARKFVNEMISSGTVEAIWNVLLGCVFFCPFIYGI